MQTRSLFREYWEVYANRSIEDRRRYYDSLNPRQREQLLHSFRSENWPELFFRNVLEQAIDEIKSTYRIDLIDLRIKAIRDGRVFLIEKEIWERIEALYEYADYVDLTFIFGDLIVSAWGKHRQFYRIRSRKRRRKYGN